MSAAPAIPLFGDAYLADTRHLSLEEHGAYLQLLMIAWRSEGCRLPDDDAKLCRMIGATPSKWRKLKPGVMAFWTLENGCWFQKRLSKERKFVEEKRSKNKSAAEARWHDKSLENNDQGHANALPDGCERNAPPPPPIPIDKSIGPEADPVKEIFDLGVKLLAGGGTDPKQARSLIGKYRREFGDGLVLEALVDCQARRISSPVEWLPRRMASARASPQHEWVSPC